MDFDPARIMQWISINAIPLMLAIVFHEVAHAYVADMCGDQTARRAGRITLNPLAHIDPIGTVLLPLFLTITKAPFHIGWAKPVPVNFFNLRKIRRDMVLVALAGPATNLAMALFCMGALRLIFTWMPETFVLALGETDPSELRQMGAATSFLVPITLMLLAGLRMNIVFMLFNLIPILPLDGGRIMNGLLPDWVAEHYERMEPLGPFLVIGFLYLIPATSDGFDNMVGSSMIMVYQLIFMQTT